MTDDSPHAAILRAVAIAALDDARAAWRTAQIRPSEDSLRTAFRACVLATRALRRASEEAAHPSEEQEMLERAALIDEYVVGLKRKLARLVEPDQSQP